jgi:hypothetical protein
MRWILRGAVRESSWESLGCYGYFSHENPAIPLCPSLCGLVIISTVQRLWVLDIMVAGLKNSIGMS